MKIARYGWRPSLPDQRDRPYTAEWMALPPSVDLRPLCPPVQDQGQEGSCTAFSTTGADWFLRMKEKLPDFRPSEAFTYYGARIYEGTFPDDSGAQVREALRDLVWHGACPEALMPYSDQDCATVPSANAKAAAAQHKVTQYLRLDGTNLGQLKACLASGYPFVSGFTVYESFESPAVERTGVVPMPAMSEQVLGGHAVCTVGYDDASHRFIVRNSWGTGWGMKGYFTIPYAYWTRRDLSDDFWTLRRSL
jgi:C1A family cysteine protease